VEQELLTLPVFSGVRVALSLVFCVVFCISLFVLFLLAIVLSVLRYSPVDILKLFLIRKYRFIILASISKFLIVYIYGNLEDEKGIFEIFK